LIADLNPTTADIADFTIDRVIACCKKRDESPQLVDLRAAAAVQLPAACILPTN
jgi:hypothetical protein